MNWNDWAQLISTSVGAIGVVVGGIYALFRLHASKTRLETVLQNDIKHLSEKVDKLESRLDKIEGKIDDIIDDLLEVSVIRTRKK